MKTTPVACCSCSLDTKIVPQSPEQDVRVWCGRLPRNTHLFVCTPQIMSRVKRDACVAQERCLWRTESLAKPFEASFSDGASETAYLRDGVSRAGQSQTQRCRCIGDGMVADGCSRNRSKEPVLTDHHFAGQSRPHLRSSDSKVPFTLKLVVSPGTGASQPHVWTSC